MKSFFYVIVYYVHRSVKEEDKPLAIGFSAFVGTLIGKIHCNVSLLKTVLIILFFIPHAFILYCLLIYWVFFSFLVSPLFCFYISQFFIYCVTFREGGLSEINFTKLKKYEDSWLALGLDINVSQLEYSNRASGIFKSIQEPPADETASERVGLRPPTISSFTSEGPISTMISIIFSFNLCI